jgi:hypothetical protein
MKVGKQKSVILRHKKFPLVIIYRDPKDSWDEFVEEMVLEELKEDGFRDYVIVTEEHDKQKSTKKDL